MCLQVFSPNYKLVGLDKKNFCNFILIWFQIVIYNNVVNVYVQVFSPPLECSTSRCLLSMDAAGHTLPGWALSLMHSSCWEVIINSVSYHKHSFYRMT